jgi:large subunit ribosomal protein L28e
MSVSNDLIWELIKRKSSFLVHRDGLTFSREPGNIKNVNQKRYSGLANAKAIDVHIDKSHNLQLSLKKTKPGRKVANTWTNFKIARGKEMFKKIRNVLRQNKYRKDLEGGAQKRAFILARADQRALHPPRWLKRKTRRYQVKKAPQKK